MPIDRPKTVEEEIDHSIDESFPASDPPSWSRGKRHDSSLQRENEEGTKTGDSAKEEQIPD